MLKINVIALILISVLSCSLVVSRKLRKVACMVSVLATLLVVVTLAAPTASAADSSKVTISMSSARRDVLRNPKLCGFYISGTDKFNSDLIYTSTGKLTVWNFSGEEQSNFYLAIVEVPGGKEGLCTVGVPTIGNIEGCALTQEFSTLDIEPDPDPKAEVTVSFNAYENGENVAVAVISSVAALDESKIYSTIDNYTVEKIETLDHFSYFVTVTLPENTNGTLEVGITETETTLAAKNTLTFSTVPAPKADVTVTFAQYENGEEVVGAVISSTVDFDESKVYSSIDNYTVEKIESLDLVSCFLTITLPENTDGILEVGILETETTLACKNTMTFSTKKPTVTTSVTFEEYNDGDATAVAYVNASGALSQDLVYCSRNDCTVEPVESTDGTCYKVVVTLPANTTGYVEVGVKSATNVIGCSANIKFSTVIPTVQTAVNFEEPEVDSNMLVAIVTGSDEFNKDLIYCSREDYTVEKLVSEYGVSYKVTVVLPANTTGVVEVGVNDADNVIGCSANKDFSTVVKAQVTIKALDFDPDFEEFCATIVSDRDLDPSLIYCNMESWDYVEVTPSRLFYITVIVPTGYTGDIVIGVTGTETVEAAEKVVSCNA